MNVPRFIDTNVFGKLTDPSKLNDMRPPQLRSRLDVGRQRKIQVRATMLDGRLRVYKARTSRHP